MPHAARAAPGAVRSSENPPRPDDVASASSEPTAATDTTTATGERPAKTAPFRSIVESRSNARISTAIITPIAIFTPPTGNLARSPSRTAIRFESGEW